MNKNQNSRPEDIFLVDTVKQVSTGPDAFMNKAVAEQKIFLNQIGIDITQQQNGKSQSSIAKQYL